MRTRSPVWYTYVSLALIAVLLYIPFFHNGLVFDDHNLFTNLTVYDYAVTPFSVRPRTFPYFTLGIVQVMFGTIEAQRIVSLSLHVICASLLFCLLRSLLEPGRNDSISAVSETHYLLPFVGACWFAINPIAVYGAGYLVERTIVLATLFSLACLCILVRAFKARSTSDVILAALLYSSAVFCKEHAIMLPVAALPLIVLVNRGGRTWGMRRAVLFLMLCLPAAISALVAAKAVVATSYEPSVTGIIAQMHGFKVEVFGKSIGVWPASMAMQARAFFLYFYYWLIPDIRFLSVDMRVDFAGVLHSPMLPISVIAFLAVPLFGLYCLSKGKAKAIFGCGLLFSWILFLPEFSTVRLQEPFVLYRSYLWAPGFAMMVMAMLAQLRWQQLLILFVFALPIQFYFARDRLQSFSSERTVWEDAAAKLSTSDVPGADRIYYNRGGERCKQGEFGAAMEDLNKVVKMNPESLNGYLGRGMIYLQSKKYAQALGEFDHVLMIKPGFGFALYRRGFALENLGRKKAALHAYQEAANAGEQFAKFRIAYLEKSGG